jgi:hypothetical protein
MVVVGVVGGGGSSGGRGEREPSYQAQLLLPLTWLVFSPHTQFSLGRHHHVFILVIFVDLKNKQMSKISIRGIQILKYTQNINTKDHSGILFSRSRSIASLAREAYIALC